MTRSELILGGGQGGWMAVTWNILDLSSSLSSSVMSQCSFLDLLLYIRHTLSYSTIFQFPVKSSSQIQWMLLPSKRPLNLICLSINKRETEIMNALLGKQINRFKIEFTFRHCRINKYRHLFLCSSYYRCRGLGTANECIMVSLDRERRMPQLSFLNKLRGRKGILVCWWRFLFEYVIEELFFLFTLALSISTIL